MAGVTTRRYNQGEGWARLATDSAHVMRLGNGMATTSFSLGSDFRLGFHLTLNSSSDEAKPFKVSSLSPRVSSPGALSVASSPALPTESATNKEQAKENTSEVAELGKSPPSLPNPQTPSLHHSHPEDPLAQLQNALEKTGFLGRKLLSPPLPVPERPLPEKRLSLSPPGSLQELELYRCHLCNFATPSKFQYNAHLNSHFDHKCPFCDYTSRTEGRLKRHVKDFHSEVSSDNWSNTSLQGGITSTDDEQQSGPGEPGKPRRHRCKQCEFVALTKSEFWEHSKTHIKAEKLLTCPKCPFVTEYKHHLEYHLRNHFGSKPFKCNKCNYSCVNKSMLNSHMKSHSNVYQYRCSDCSYATKYCHSLKLHLRKYGHKPATVLNSDGSLNPYPIIDVYGTRRGPRPKKGGSKFSDHEARSIDLGPYGGPLIPGPLPVQSGMPFLYPPPHLMSSYNGAIFPRPPLSPLAIRSIRELPYACTLCEFATDQQDSYMKHLMGHAASENQDLCNLYGITSDTLNNEHQSPSQLAILPPPSSAANSEHSPAVSPTSQQSSPNIEEHSVTDKQNATDASFEEERPETTPLDLSHPREQQQQQTSSRNRRKGKAFKLNRIIRFQEQAFETDDEFMSEDSCTQREDSEDGHTMKEMNGEGLKLCTREEEDRHQMSPSPSSQSPSNDAKQEEGASSGHIAEAAPENWDEDREAYACHYCDMSFKDCVMYTVHMGYHGYRDPFKCNMCGHESKDKVAFFLHIARAAHL